MTAYKNGVAQTPVQSSISTSKLIFAYVAMDNVSQGMTLRFAEQDWTQAPTGVDSTYELSSTNLDDTTLSPNQSEQATDYFNTVLYTGVSGDQSITGVGFQPDLTWIKSRSNAYNHNLLDSSRGGRRWLGSNSTSAEDYNTSAYISSFDSDGFTLDGDGGSTNINTATYASWNWLANGGTTSSNTDGTITSTVQASTDAGFSIVTYTGTGSNGTIGHGLGVAPKMIIVKVRSTTNNWAVYHDEIGNTKGLLLDDNGGSLTSSLFWNDTSPTTDVFSVSTGNSVNKLSETYVAYCFAEVEGFSKIGAYNTNNSADGTYIYLGFSPSFIMFKSITATGYEWNILDNKRTSYNVRAGYLIPNETSAEVVSANSNVDFLSNGFKLRSAGGDINTSGHQVIYMAFAEVPYKWANAR
jgi:hypothetical protein